jgi:N-acetylglutamate synthase-like GNAT family acetyltransferase
MQILENQKELLQDFIRLNEEWISTYFELEEVDFQLAANPYKVIENGGFVFSVLVEGVVAGVCALFNTGNGVYELARMAVSPQYQGQGYGDKLIEACFSKLKEVGAEKVYLVSNTKLTSAIALYKKHNFEVTFEGAHPVYARANICMECKISSALS